MGKEEYKGKVITCERRNIRGKSLPARGGI